MSDSAPDPRHPVDPAINSPGREGLTGTAPASLYAPAVDREQVTIAPDFAPASAQPAWRQDFPIDWPQDLYVERRDFMKFLVLTSAAFTLGQVCDRRAELVSQARRAPTHDADCFGRRAGDRRGHGVHVSGRTRTVRAGRLTSSEFVAFSQKCTHLSCAVIPRSAEGSFYCPCHEGRFDIRTGSPTAGPPRRPLTRIVLDIRGRDIYAVGVEERTI